MIGDPVTDFDLHHLALLVGVLEVEGRVQHIGCFLIVVEHEVPAHCGNLDREANTESPARDVDLMNGLVADFAIAGVPDPMPVVMKAVAREWLQWRGTSP